MNYLKYIERDAENLQFFLWARAYQHKFDKLPETERKLSPQWSEAQGESDAAQPQAQPQKVSPDIAAALKGTGLDSAPRVAETSVTDSEKANPFYTPPRTPSNNSGQHAVSSEMSSDETSRGWSSHQPSTANTSTHIKRKAEEAYDDAGLKWQPCEWRKSLAAHID